MEEVISKNNILIRVDGSQLIGLGHIFRMKSLAVDLINRGYQVEFMTLADPTANRFLEDLHLDCHIFSHDSFEDVLTYVVKNRNPHLIIQDIMATSQSLITKIRAISSAKIINFDDIGAGLEMADTVINPVVFHWGECVDKSSGASIYEGPSYMILQPELLRYVTQEKKISSDGRNVLMSFGGMDRHRLNERVLNAIKTIDLPLNIAIYGEVDEEFSPNFKMAVEKSSHVVRFEGVTSNLFEKFHGADLIICGGGNVLYELATMGVPSVCIATEQHEIVNVDYWSKIGTTVTLGWEKMIATDQLCETVGELLSDRQRRSEMSELGKKTIDHRGLERVSAIIEKTLAD